MGDGRCKFWRNKIPFKIWNYITQKNHLSRIILRQVMWHRHKMSVIRPNVNIFWSVFLQTAPWTQIKQVLTKKIWCYRRSYDNNFGGSPLWEAVRGGPPPKNWIFFRPKLNSFIVRKSQKVSATSEYPIIVQVKKTLGGG